MIYRPTGRNPKIGIFPYRPRSARNAKTSGQFIGMVSSMTPELETLDQLQGSDLPLEIILRLFPDADAFRRGVMGLITCGDVCLLTVGGIEVPAWRHRELFVDGLVMQEMRNLKLSITAHGVGRIA